MCLNPLKVTVKPFLNKDGKHEIVVGNFFEFLNPSTGEMAGHYLIPCGKCSECLANKRREWSERLMLEASLYEPNMVYMVTLTYDNFGITECDNVHGLWSLKYEHFREFCRKIRDSVRFDSERASDCVPRHTDQLRYFCAMEYGDRSMRPHAHVVLFGLDLQAVSGNVPISVTEEGTLFSSPFISRFWNRGNNSVCLASANSLAYVAGYVTKKLSKLDEYSSLGLAPERAFMSKHPAIGVRFFEENKELIKETGMYVNPLNGNVSSIPRYALRSVFADDPSFCAIISHGKQLSAIRKLEAEDFVRGERAEVARARVVVAKNSQKRSNKKL